MRFDNAARMKQLDGLLKSKKTDKRHKTGGRSPRKGEGSSAGSKKNLGDSSTFSGSTAYHTMGSHSSVASRNSAVSRSSSSHHSAGRTRPPGCKEVLHIQESWGLLKSDQVTVDAIGENIIFRMIEAKHNSRSHPDSKSIHPDAIEECSKLIVASIDQIVSLAGPGLFEEDFEHLRHDWLEAGLDPYQVSRVLLDGLRDSVVRVGMFSDTVSQAWQATVVTLTCRWASQD